MIETVKNEAWRARCEDDRHSQLYKRQKDSCLHWATGCRPWSSTVVLFIHWASPVFLPGEGNGTPLQYCCPENPMDGGAWWAAVHGVAKSQTRLSDFTFTFHFHAFEKEMATRSNVLAWRIPWTEKPGRLQSMGSHRVGHDWSDLAVFLPVMWANKFPFLASLH